MQHWRLCFILICCGLFAPAQPDTLWSCKIKKPITFKPLLEISRYYIANEEGTVYCLDTESGRVLWETRAPQETGKKVKKQPAPKKVKGKSLPSVKAPIKYGFLSTFVANPNYLFGCNVDDNVYAFNKDNGVRIWNYKANFDEDKFAPLWMYDNLLIFKTEDSLVVALSQESGTEVWKYKCSAKVGELSLRSNQLHFPTADKQIIALNAGTGKEIAKINLGNTEINEEKGVCVIDNNYCLLNDSGDVAWFSTKKKKEVWHQPYRITMLLETEERLVAYNDSLLIGLKNKNGNQNWKLEGVFSDKTLPIVREGKLYFHASSKNKVMIINTKTGEYIRSYLVKGTSVIAPSVNDKQIVLVIEDRIFAIRND